MSAKTDDVKIGINDVQVQLHRAHAEGDCAPILMRVIVMMADEISALQDRVDVMSQAMAIMMCETLADELDLAADSEISYDSQ